MNRASLLSEGIELSIITTTQTPIFRFGAMRMSFITDDRRRRRRRRCEEAVPYVRVAGNAHKRDFHSARAPKGTATHCGACGLYKTIYIQCCIGFARTWIKCACRIIYTVLFVWFSSMMRQLIRQGHLRYGIKALCETNIQNVCVLKFIFTKHES